MDSECNSMVMLLLLLCICFSYFRYVELNMISTLCTTNSLARTSTTTTMIEGTPLAFSVIAYTQACEASPCVACSLSCPSCAYYTGIPYFAFDVVDFANATVPDVTCSVGSMTNAGQFSASCLATNSYASNSTQFRLRMNITESGNVVCGSMGSVLLSAGPISIPDCTAAWKGAVSTFKAGDNATLTVRVMDAFGNNVSPATGRLEMLKVSTELIASAGTIHSISSQISNNSQLGYQDIIFSPTSVGQFLLQVVSKGTGLPGSPFPLTVIVGPISIANCIAAWQGGLNTFAAGTEATVTVFLRDSDNNSFIQANSSPMNFGILASLVDNSGQNRSVPDPMVSLVMYPDLGYVLISFTPKLVGHFLIVIGAWNASIANSPLAFTVTAGDIYVPACTATWLSRPNILFAGDQATIRIQLIDAYQNNVSLQNGRSDFFNFTVSVEGKVGNSKYIADISMVSEYGLTGYQQITFYPLKSGSFWLQIGDGADWLSNSPLSYTVFPGEVYIPAVRAEWVDDIYTFKAGTQAALRILLMDAYNNNISWATGKVDFVYFDLSVAGTSSGSNAITNLSQYQGSGLSPYQFISFDTRLAGNLKLLVESNNQSIYSSPLSFTVIPGPISISQCTGEWKYGAKEFQVLSKINFIITQRDEFGNPIPFLYYYYVQVFILGNNLSLPIDDISMKLIDKSSFGHLSLTYTIRYLGDLLLSIGSMTENISGSPFSFFSFAGNIEPMQTNCTGIGLNDSIAGDTSVISIQLQDIFGQPAICLSKNISIKVQLVLGSSIQQAADVAEDVSNPNNTGLYQATYKAEKAGTYDLVMSWTNTLICKGHKKTVFPGPVNESMSIVTGPGYQPYAKVNVWYEIFAELKDSYGNSVPNNLQSLNFSIGGPGNYEILDFVVQGESYMAMYMLIDIGTYYLKIEFEGNDLMNSPFPVKAQLATFFPMANDDVVWTWEGVLVSFDVLSNDYVANGNKILFMTDQTPQHGSLLMAGKFMHYTPFEDYFGPDKMTYILADEQNLTAYGNVNISVWMEPPQVISWPSTLQALEGQPIPVQGGFGGFQVAYTDEVAILDVRLQAEHGLLYLPAETIQLWYSIGYQSPSRYTSGGANSFLSFSGSVIPLNNVLQSLRYTGNEYYNGNDTILLSIIDSSSRGDEATVMVTVMAINDPPYITAPAYMLADNTTGRLTSFIGSTIFFTVTSTVPGITVGDPDQKDIRDDGSLLQLEVVMQVTDGTLQVTLPISTVTTAENRDAGDYLWKPLEQAIFLDTSYNMTGQGLKFRASVDDCNKALDSLRYNGSASGVELTLIIDDMGNYGCYRDCSQNFIVPLLAEAKVVIFPKRPLSRWWAYTKTVRVFASTVGSIGAAGLTLLCLVICLVKLTARKRKEAETLDNDDMKEEQACEESRVYNPMWIPCTLDSSGSKFVSTPNPLIVSQRQGELRQRLRDAEMEIKKLALTGYKRISITALEDSAANAVVNPEEESRKINFSLFKSAES